jgi:nucleoid-associated protein EbfC
MGSGYSKMKKQARAMEQQFEKMREDMQNTTATGSSGSGLVTVVLNGAKELKEIRIKPECVDPSDIEGLQDLIIAAYADAAQKLAKESPAGGLPGGMSLPFGF